MHNATFNPNCILFYVNTIQMLCTHYHNRMEELVTEWPTLPACDTQHDYKIFPVTKRQIIGFIRQHFSDGIIVP